jgi:signal transduction histidine kinase
VAGRAAPVSGLGDRDVPGIQVRPGQDEIRFDFVGLSFVPGNVLRYEYRLGEAEWSRPMEERVVHYAGLTPGTYRFAVRAVRSDGIASPEPATVEFEVYPRVWRRAWFQGLLLAIVAAVTGLAHGIRVKRLLAIERVRTRIATDLHDDVGSTLSQIAILSDVAQRRLTGHSASTDTLERIGVLSRQLTDAIGDIVWAVQPRNDLLSDLEHRMRRFASEVLSGRNIAIHWPAEEQDHDLALDAEHRRQVYLIFKEAINNVLRHSGATEVRIGLRVARGRLDLKVADNGCGIGSIKAGNGLASMGLRAQRFGGELEVRSGPGEGTTIRLTVALR